MTLLCSFQDFGLFKLENFSQNEFQGGRGGGGGVNKIIKKCLNLDENDTLEKAYQKAKVGEKITITSFRII